MTTRLKKKKRCEIALLITATIIVSIFFLKRLVELPRNYHVSVAPQTNSSHNIFWTKDDLEGIQHFMNSCAAIKKSLIIAKQSSGQSLSTRKQTVVRILLLYEKALVEAGLVDNKTLKKIHPNLMRHFREEYEAGIRLRINGWEKGLTDTGSNLLLTKFEIWMNRNT